MRTAEDKAVGLIGLRHGFSAVLPRQLSGPRPRVRYKTTLLKQAEKPAGSATSIYLIEQITLNFPRYAYALPTAV